MNAAIQKYNSIKLKQLKQKLFFIFYFTHLKASHSIQYQTQRFFKLNLLFLSFHIYSQVYHFLNYFDTFLLNILHIFLVIYLILNHNKPVNSKQCEFNSFESILCKCRLKGFKFSQNLQIQSRMTQSVINKMVGTYKITKIHSIDDHNITIYQGLNAQSNSIWSLKKITTSNFNETLNSNSQNGKTIQNDQAQYLANEVSISKKLKDNIFLKCHHILRTKNSCYYIYNRYPQLSLKQLINFINGTKITEKNIQNIKIQFNQGGLLSQVEIYDFQKISIVLQLLNCLEIFESSGIVHNNFTVSNIFLSQDKNQIDDEDIKISIGGFYQSQRINIKNNSKQFCKDIRDFGKIIKSLKLFNTDHSHNLKRKKFQEFIQFLINMNQLNYMSVSLIRQRLQKLTLCEFSQVKIVSLNDSFGATTSNPKTQFVSQTTSSGNFSFQLNHQKQMDEQQFKNQIRQTQMSQKLVVRKYSQSPDKKKDKSPNSPQTVDMRIKEQSDEAVSNNQYLKECEKGIKIAFKVCIFAIANHENEFTNYFIQLIENMITTIKVKNIRFSQQKIEAFEKSLNELRKVNFMKQQTKDNVFISDKGLKNNKNKVDEPIVNNFRRKLLKSYEKYKDAKILMNGCLLIQFYKGYDLIQSLGLKSKGLQRVIRLKIRSEQMSVEQMKLILSGQRMTIRSDDRSNSRSLCKNNKYGVK